ENGMVVGALGDGFLVAAFEEVIELGTGAAFNQGDQVFDPDGAAGTPTNLDSDEAALIVGAVAADGLGAWAKGGDSDFDGKDEIDFLTMGGGVEAGGVIHDAVAAGDGGLFDEEERELHFEVGDVGLETGLEGMEDVINIIDMNNAAVFVEGFDEAAHVGAAKFVGEIDEQADGGDGALGFAGLVQDGDGKAESADADFVDAELAVVALALFVVEEGGVVGLGWIGLDWPVGLGR